MILLSLHPLIKNVDMSVLESIRKRTGLLVGLVGLAIILFILQLSLGNGMSWSMGGDSETSVGQINGTTIDYRVFADRVNKLKEEITRGQEATEQQRQQAVNQAWEDMIRELVYEKEFEKLGITCSEEELYNQMLVQPHSIVVSQFRDQQTQKIDPRFANPDGSLNVKELNSLVASFKPEQEKMWTELEKYVKRQRLVEKYAALIRGGLYTTMNETKMNFAAQNTNFDVRFVMKKYADIPDADIKISDQDLQEYYNSHMYEFQNENSSRSIEYVVWDVVPSQADIDTLKAELSRVKVEFGNTDLSEDSAFTQSENNGMPDVNSYLRSRMSPEIDSTFFEAPPKTTFGPYREGNIFKVIKMRGTEMVSDSAHVRHILIAKPNPRMPDVKRTAEQAKKLADSIKDVVAKDRKKWDELVEKFSDDGGKKRPDIKANPELLSNKEIFPTGDSTRWRGKGGDYGWMNESSGYVPEFKSFGLTGKKGEIGVVMTEYGYHIMEILETSKGQQKKYKIATVSRELKPSEATRQDYMQKASEFAGQNNTDEKFQKAVETQKLNKRVNDDLKENDQFIAGFQNPNESPKQLIRNVYKAKAGEVLPPIAIGDRIVVTLVKKIKEKGPLPLEYVKEEITAKVRNEKKAEQIINDLTGKMSGVKNIDELAAKAGMKDEQTGMLLIEKMENLQFNSFAVPKYGSEPELIATATTLKKGEMSKPGKGVAGVWVVQVENIKEPQAPKDMKEQQRIYMMGYNSRSQYEPNEALKKLANIEDHKARFDF